MIHFDTIVVGKGLVGAAAAKYLSASKKSVAIIGPDEPSNYNKATVFAAHYDQARVQRIIGKDEVWTRLNNDAAKTYPTIQEQSGVYFHKPVGCLYVNPYGNDKYLSTAVPLSKTFDLGFKSYKNASEISEDFQDFQFPEASQGLFESSPSGLINPRGLLQAQLNILEQNRATILRETVVALSFSDELFCVKTAEGNSYFASKVLLATGSFVNFLDLMPQKLDLRTKSEVIILVKVTESKANELSKMPSLLYEINNEQLEGIYMIQPVQYPDGHFYFKMGCNFPEDIWFKNLEQVQDWFRNGDSDVFSDKMIQALKIILPDLEITEYLTKKCITSYTAHGRPYIGETMQKGLFVAGGCNGYSAMCSDAIGRVTAHLIENGHIPEEYPKNAFELSF